MEEKSIMLIFKEALGLRSKRTDALAEEWKRRLESILGSGEISYVKRDASEPRHEYEFRFSTNAGRPYTMVYNIHAYYDFPEKGNGSEISEHHSFIRLSPLPLGGFDHGGFTPSAKALKYRSEIKLLERALGEAPEPIVVRDEDMPRKDLGWRWAPKSYVDILGDGYINVLSEAGKMRFLPKGYGYIRFTIIDGVQAHLDGSFEGMTALYYDTEEGRLKLSHELGFVKRIINKVTDGVISAKN